MQAELWRGRRLMQAELWRGRRLMQAKLWRGRNLQAQLLLQTVLPSRWLLQLPLQTVLRYGWLLLLQLLLQAVLRLLLLLALLLMLTIGLLLDLVELRLVLEPVRLLLLWYEGHERVVGHGQYGVAAALAVLLLRLLRAQHVLLAGQAHVLGLLLSVVGGQGVLRTQTWDLRSRESCSRHTGRCNRCV